MHRSNGAVSIQVMSLLSQKSLVSVSIATNPGMPLTRDQKAFNTLVRKIEARRTRLAEWDMIIPRFRKHYVSELLPLQEKERELQIELVLALDRCHARKGVTKNERRKLSLMIVELAESVLARQEHDEIKSLHNKHSRSDFDAEETARMEDMKSALEEILGVDLGDGVDMRSPEEIMKKVDSRFQAEYEAWEARQARRKKSAKEQARTARVEAEAKQLSQCVQAVYRKLASALHPDRELDPQERQRKTGLMQRANEAYEKADLLQLLGLQLELEHIDQSHLRTMDAEKLKRYNSILKGQLSDLDGEIRYVEAEFAAQFGLPPFERHDPRELLPRLNADVAACEIGIRHLHEQLQAAGDPRRLKDWLKTVTLRRMTPFDPDLLF